jgi:DNA recombination protein RmuC
MVTLLILLIALSFANAVLLVVLLIRSTSGPVERVIREELRQSREDETRSARDLREEVAGSLKSTADSLVRTIGELGAGQRASHDMFAQQLKELTSTMQTRVDDLRSAVETQLKEIQETNAKKLEEMRRTVDEQLQTTLEKRLAESFKVVSGHLESVQRGLGEMQALATGVGDLKRVLTNVKARGTWAEFQLGAILEEVLTPDQFQRNVQTKELSSERVEYAVRLPGRNGEATVWLPIDSKFPRESYDRLMDAAETCDVDAVQAAVAELARTIRVQARDIQEKYLSPPSTTDFGILFLPTEGLYAEVLRIPNLTADLQQNCRVLVAGPTNLAALLNSLRIGFQTLAIERRASEVWSVLRAVKTEFMRFGGVLAKVKKQLESATRTIEMTGTRTRAMERKLREVQDLPATEAADLFQLPEVAQSLDVAEIEVLSGTLEGEES